MDIVSQTVINRFNISTCRVILSSVLTPVQHEWGAKHDTAQTRSAG
jgi:hypothetical protein